jgi:hypothetical protein
MDEPRIARSIRIEGSTRRCHGINAEPLEQSTEKHLCGVQK